MHEYAYTYIYILYVHSYYIFFNEVSDFNCVACFNPDNIALRWLSTLRVANNLRLHRRDAYVCWLHGQHFAMSAWVPWLRFVPNTQKSMDTKHGKTMFWFLGITILTFSHCLNDKKIWTAQNDLLLVGKSCYINLYLLGWGLCPKQSRPSCAAISQLDVGREWEGIILDHNM